MDPSSVNEPKVLRLERAVEIFEREFKSKFNSSRSPFLRHVARPLKRVPYKAYVMKKLKNIQEKIKDLATDLDEMQARHDELRAELMR